MYASYVSEGVKFCNAFGTLKHGEHVNFQKMGFFRDGCHLPPFWALPWSPTLDKAESLSGFGSHACSPLVAREPAKSGGWGVGYKSTALGNKTTHKCHIQDEGLTKNHGKCLDPII